MKKDLNRSLKELIDKTDSRIKRLESLILIPETSNHPKAPDYCYL